MRVFSWSRESAVDALIDRSALPLEHRELVRRVVRDAQLPLAASLDVTEELLCHFEDGLARGVRPDALVNRFGPVNQAAELIRRGQRRRRLADPWRRRTLLAATLFGAAATTTYVSSAVALHAADPLRATTRTNANAPGALEWTRGARVASAARERTRARLRNAGVGTRRSAIAANLDEAAALRREASLETELAAIDIIHDAMTALSGTDIDDSVAAALGRAIAPDGVLLRASVVRAAYDDLLDRVYSGRGQNGRITAKGLRVLQALNGKTHPGLTSVVLEPAFFVMPARRWEAEREIEAIAADVAGASRVAPNDSVTRFRARQAALARKPLHALRYFPIAVTVPRLAAAAERARIAARAIESARRRR